MKPINIKKALIASVISAILLGGCSGGESESKSDSPLVNQEINYLSELSSDKAQNTLSYTKQLSSLVDDLEALEKDFLLSDGILTKVENYQTAYTNLYMSNMTSFSTQEKEALRSAYVESRDALEAMESELILAINRVALDEVNLDIYKSENTLVAMSTIEPSFVVAATLTVSAIAGTKSLLSSISKKYPSIIEGATGSEAGRKFVIETFRNNGLEISDNSTAAEILEQYNSISTWSFLKKRAIANAIEDDINDAIMNATGKYKADITDDLVKSKAEFVTGMKEGVSDVASRYYGTIADPLGNVPVVSTIKGAVDLVGDIKSIVSDDTKKLKTLAVSKSTIQEDIVTTTTTLKSAKSSINTLNNKDGLDKVDLNQAQNAYNSILQEKAKNDGDGDNALLTSPARVLAASNSLLSDGVSAESNLTLLTSDMNETFDIVAVVDPKEYELNTTNTLPNDLVLEIFEDVVPETLETTPLKIVSVSNETTALSAEKISEDSDAIKYRVSAVVGDIYKNANISLEIFDGSALMGTTQKQILSNTSTHTQTLTWDVELFVGSNVVLKLSRSDDLSYSEYITLSGSVAPLQESIAGNYIGTFTTTTDDPDNCLPLGTQDTLWIDIGANNVVFAKITLGGEIYSDTGISVNSNTIVDNGARDNLAWSGNILGNKIEGTFTDLEDGCNGSFSVNKN